MLSILCKYLLITNQVLLFKVVSCVQRVLNKQINYKGESNLSSNLSCVHLVNQGIDGYGIFKVLLVKLTFLKIASQKLKNIRKLRSIQFPKINIVPLVNKPYVNEVTLTGQNPP